MQLGTLDRTPPPFFRQGVSALTKLLFCSALAVFLMVADGRFQLVVTARAVLATALLPVERALMVPREILLGGRDYLEGISQARAAEDAARVQMVRQAERVAQVDLLERENQRLRALLELRPAVTVRSLAAEVLYEAADPFSRKVFIDRGERHGVVTASPVVNESGVMGQVTRVYPLTAEVTLLTDKDAAIPVLNTRTQQRSAAFGGPGQGAALELRYMAANSDVKVGDVLTTSGVDGVYPSGLPVATVAAVERQADAGFARITLQPSAPLDGVRHVLVLEPLSTQLPPPPPPEPEAKVDPRSKRKP
ncbi:rod shape-determining protein MreC [Aquincola tertiaricarbonis]|uniref:rod shape-determining protein MreC n=1 Tax=Aquincola tertiaricarbonis TaxID=391953 RepID=UPI0006152B34|nr:rod shape-determining protein MreC [Aquincola tertiaricarbonis]